MILRWDTICAFWDSFVTMVFYFIFSIVITFWQCYNTQCSLSYSLLRGGILKSCALTSSRPDNFSDMVTRTNWFSKFCLTLLISYGWIQSVATYAFRHRICLLEFFNASKFKTTQQFQRANATAKRVCCKWIVNPPKIGCHWNGKRGMETGNGNRERARGTRGRAKLNMEKKNTDLTLILISNFVTNYLLFPVPRSSN